MAVLRCCLVLAARLVVPQTKGSILPTCTTVCPSYTRRSEPHATLTEFAAHRHPRRAQDVRTRTHTSSDVLRPRDFSSRHVHSTKPSQQPTLPPRTLSCMHSLTCRAPPLPAYRAPTRARSNPAFQSQTRQLDCHCPIAKSAHQTSLLFLIHLSQDTSIQ